jgi:hypothetical protein
MHLYNFTMKFWHYVECSGRNQTAFLAKFTGYFDFDQGIIGDWGLLHRITSKIAKLRAR